MIRARQPDRKPGDPRLVGVGVGGFKVGVGAGQFIAATGIDSETTASSASRAAGSSLLELVRGATPLCQPDNRGEPDSGQIPKGTLQGFAHAPADLARGHESTESASQGSTPEELQRLSWIRGRLREEVIAKAEQQLGRLFKGPCLQKVTIGLVVVRTTHFHESTREVLVSIGMWRKDGCRPVVADRQLQSVCRAPFPMFMRHGSKEMTLDCPGITCKNQARGVNNHVRVLCAVIRFPCAFEHSVQVHGTGPSQKRRCRQNRCFACTCARPQSGTRTSRSRGN